MARAPRFSFRVDPKTGAVRGHLSSAPSISSIGFYPASFGRDSYVRGKEAPEFLRVELVKEGEKPPGFVLARKLDASDVNKHCRKGLEELSRSPIVYLVYASAVHHPHRGQGLGALLYATALVLASLEGAPIVADDCFGGITSELASQVWRSRALAEVAHVRGNVAVLKRQ